MHYLISYDIVSDSRRNKLSHFLVDYGRRVQLSVFEFDLTEKTLDKVLKGIVRYVSTDEDSVRVYRLCAQCAQEIQTYGIQRGEAQPRDVIIV